MKIFAIGDTHGCAAELQEMLDIIDAQKQSGDLIIYLGDYIDRGPNSKGVVDIILERRNRGLEEIALMGNHEDMMLDQSSSWFYNGGTQTVESYGGFGSWKLPPDHEEFYNNLKLFHFHGKWFFVHAGLDPTEPYDKQVKHTLIWDRTSVGYKGVYVGDWNVVYGHTPTEKPIVRPHQIGIDTGCVFGYSLTCAVINPDTDTPETVRFITVKAKRKYY